MKGPRLLWQSPRPSVLPCSTSCSKADLWGTETSWSAEERKTGGGGKRDPAAPGKITLR